MIRPYERPGFIISTSVKTILLKYIEKLKDAKYVLETEKVNGWTSYVLFLWDEYVPVTTRNYPKTHS